MDDSDLDTPVPDWVIDYPETQPVFRELGINDACGGRSLGYVCRSQGLEPIIVLSRLRRTLHAAGHTTGQHQAPEIVSVQVGLPRQLGTAGAQDPLDQPWTSGIFKAPVGEPVPLGIEGLAGDGQADREHHGGPDKALLLYAASHYMDWRQALQQADLPWGAFGENLTIAGLTELDVCIGDTWRIGAEVTVQVSQPRQPCWKLARRWRIHTLTAQVAESGYTGWYVRVLTPGIVAPGLPLTLLQRPCPDWPVARASQVRHERPYDLLSSASLAALPLLSHSWRTTLTARLQQQPQ